MAHARPVSQPAGAVAWPGLVWAGPRSGPPAMPHASDCDRPPETIEVDGPVPPRRTQLHRHRADDRSAWALAERRSESVGAKSKSRRRAAGVGGAGGREPCAASGAGHGDRRRRRRQRRLRRLPDFRAPPCRAAGAPPRRQRALPVDGARRRRPAGARRRGHACTPIAARRPLWARTDAGGQVWLHPRVRGAAGVGARGAGAQALGRRHARLGAAAARPARRPAGAAGAATGRADAARLDLVFLVDATGSMADEIHKLRQSMQAMADQIARLPSRPQICFGLVAYRDRGDAFFVRAHDFTNDLGAFQQVLGATAGRRRRRLRRGAERGAAHRRAPPVLARRRRDPAGAAGGRRAAAPGLRRALVRRRHAGRAGARHQAVHARRQRAGPRRRVRVPPDWRSTPAGVSSS